MKKLTALLGLAAIQMHSNIFGGAAHARFSQEQLDTIEGALENAGQSDQSETIEGLNSQITKLNETVSGLQATDTAVQDALTQAFEANGLTLEEGQTPIDAIALLGAKCKEYGSATTTHTIPGTDGKDDAGTGEQLVEGYLNPNDAHNKYFNPNSK